MGAWGKSSKKPKDARLEGACLIRSGDDKVGVGVGTVGERKAGG